VYANDEENLSVYVCDVVGNYSIVISSGLFTNGIETVEVVNPNWPFRIAEASYNSSSYTSNYLI